MGPFQQQEFEGCLINSDSQVTKLTLTLSLLSIACFTYAYHGTFSWLYERYSSPASHYSHGFLIPLISAYLIWKKKDQLQEVTLSSSMVGLFLIGLALIIHITSIWIHVFFISGFSILILVVGLSLYLFGSELTLKIAFPLGFLVFMFPLPGLAISSLSFPLKLLVANLAAWAVKTAGIPLIQEGSIIRLSDTSLIIGDPCSGIRSLISLLALGALISYYSETSMPRKVILLLFVIPIAIITNTLRVCTLILAANWFGGQWASPDHLFHTISGMAVFFLSMVLLLLVMRALE